MYTPIKTEYMHIYMQVHVRTFALSACMHTYHYKNIYTHIAIYVYIHIHLTYTCTADVSGGYSPSIFDAMRKSVEASKAFSFKFKKPDDYKPISHHEALYMATIGGAQGSLSSCTLIYSVYNRQLPIYSCIRIYT